MAMIIFASPPDRFRQHRAPVEWRDYAGATPQSESLVKIGILRTIWGALLFFTRWTS